MLLASAGRRFAKWIKSDGVALAANLLPIEFSVDAIPNPPNVAIAGFFYKVLRPLATLFWASSLRVEKVKCIRSSKRMTEAKLCDLLFWQSFRKLLIKWYPETHLSRVAGV